jgi:hypothetical protein
MPSKCRLYAPLNEGAGVTVADPRGWSGGFVGGTSWASGPWGPELDFPLAVASGVLFGAYLGPENVSVVALAQAVDSGTARTLVGKRVGLNGWQFFRNTTGNLALRVMSSNLSTSLPLPIGQYVAVGVSFTNGQGATFYALGASGLSVQTVLSPVIHVPGTEPLWIGAYDNNGQPANPWVGRIGAAMVFDGVLAEGVMVDLLNDVWSGRFGAIRGNSPRRVVYAGALGVPAPPPPPPPAPRNVVRWFPGLRRAG